ncbi:MAG: hypothetical protein GY705_03850 [Bacteroidetes bacterium]|nr:hypothetical protein [Bacteroidota bacterium]
MKNIRKKIFLFYEIQYPKFEIKNEDEFPFNDIRAIEQWRLGDNPIDPVCILKNFVSHSQTAISR